MYSYVWKELNSSTSIVLISYTHHGTNNPHIQCVVYKRKPQNLSRS
jgi:hypothetical protein